MDKLFINLTERARDYNKTILPGHSTLGFGTTCWMPIVITQECLQNWLVDNHFDMGATVEYTPRHEIYCNVCGNPTLKVKQFFYTTNKTDIVPQIGNIKICINCIGEEITI